MELPKIYVFLAGELLIAFVGISALLFFLLLRSYRDSRRMLEQARARIDEFKQFEAQYQRSKQDLRKFMRGFAHLKKKLTEAENNPHHLQRIAALEEEIDALQPYPEQVRALQQELTELRNRVAQGSAEDSVGGEPGEDHESGDFRVYEPGLPSHFHQEEIKKLRESNNEKIRIIQELRECLLADNDGAHEQAAELDQLQG